MRTPTPPSPTEYQAVIRSPPETVNDAHDFLEGLWELRPDVSGEDRMAIETVLSELVTNVIQNNPHREIFCDVKVSITNEAVSIETTDTGDEAKAETTAIAMPHETAEHGRGLPLVNLLADSVEYRWTDSRNLWRVTRARRPLNPPATE
jgi:serine/threonine-protein kinase RsbW